MLLYNIKITNKNNPGKVGLFVTKKANIINYYGYLLTYVQEIYINLTQNKKPNSW